MVVKYIGLGFEQKTIYKTGACVTITLLEKLPQKPGRFVKNLNTLDRSVCLSQG